VVASGSADKTVRLWDPRSGRALATLEGHTDGVTAVAFAPDGAVVASGSLDATVRLWDVASGRCVATFLGFTGDDWITYTPDGFFVSSPAATEKVLLAFRREFAGGLMQDLAEGLRPNPSKVAEALQGAAADQHRCLHPDPEADYAGRNAAQAVTRANE